MNPAYGHETWVPQIHLIGAGGAGMTALSEVLLDFGWRLTGSDLQPVDQPLPGTPLGRNDSPRQLPGAFGQSPRHGRFFRIHQGHDSANVPATADLVVFSPAISVENPERVAARSMRIPELSYVELLGQLLSVHAGICIAGTHGKTTTSAMTAAILREAGVASSAIVGGEVIQYGRSGWARSDYRVSSPPDPLFVAEACEYRRHFLHFHPRVAAILNIESDHFDCFETLADTHEVFAEFASQVQASGTLIVRADCPLMDELRADCPAKVETFLPVCRASDNGHNSIARADWAISRLSEESDRTVFDIVHRGCEFGTAELLLPGLHNAENALAAIAMSHAAGVSGDDACAAVSRFRGVRRRFEEVGTWNGVTLIDDYAHHPTAIKSTLEAARQRYSDRRIVVAFQPHQVSRTQNLMREFSTSFGAADEVLLVPIFSAREDTDVAESTLQELAHRIKVAGCSIKVLTSLDQLETTLEDSAQPGDVWLTLGAGNINRIPHEFARTLQRNYAG